MMVASGRLEAAIAGPQAVAGASGLLAAFNEGGALSPLEVHAAMVISRLWDESDQAVMLAAALAVRGTRFGHVCIRLDTQRDAMVIEGQPPEVVEALPWPDPEGWVAAVSRSPMVGDGRGEEPLVLDGDRLYLERYFRHEERVVNLIGTRTAVPRATLSPESRTVLDGLLPPVSDNKPNLQHAAAVNALTGRLTVVAGGPGTGKTYTVARMLAALARDLHGLPAGGAVRSHREGGRPAGGGHRRTRDRGGAPDRPGEAGDATDGHHPPAPRVGVGPGPVRPPRAEPASPRHRGRGRDVDGLAAAGRQAHGRGAGRRHSRAGRGSVPVGVDRGRNGPRRHSGSRRPVARAGTAESRSGRTRDRRLRGGAGAGAPLRGARSDRRLRRRGP